MNPTIEESKRETKAAVEREIDRYYDEFERGSDDPDCKIGDFERIVMDHKRRLDEILRDGAGKALSSVDTGDKKMP